MVRCECRPWFAGRNCQINLKLLLIVGCVSVILMIVIACGVSCFCCRDRQHGKDSIPCEYSDNAFKPTFFIFFIVHLFYSSLRNQRFQNARKYGKATWVHDGSPRRRGSRRWKAKSKYFADNTNHSFMFLIPRKYSFTQHANNVNICFSIP